MQNRFHELGGLQLEARRNLFQPQQDKKL